MSLSVNLQKYRHVYCSAVVVAAGASTRMGSDKLMLDLRGKPVLAHTLLALNQSAAIDEIIVVTRPDLVDRIAAWKEVYMIGKMTKIVRGGATRTESALAGVSETSRKTKIICIHDGARPFVTRELIDDAIHHARLYHAAAPAVPIKDTVKSAEHGVVTGTPDRASLFAIQTPQAFDADLIKGALTKAVSDGIAYPDDCAAVEALGVKVRLSKGSEQNIKITTPADMTAAEAIMKQWGGRPV